MLARVLFMFTQCHVNQVCDTGENTTTQSWTSVYFVFLAYIFKIGSLIIVELVYRKLHLLINMNTPRCPTIGLEEKFHRCLMCQ